MADKKKVQPAGRATARGAPKKGRSFGALCEEWFESEILGRGVKRPEATRRVIDRYILPKIGEMSAAEVAPRHITRMLDGVKTAYPATANQMLRITRRVYTFGVRRGSVSGNPTFDLTHRQDAGGTERARTRALSPGELAQFFAAIGDASSLGVENLLAIQLLLALCVRKGELMAAQWKEFDLEGRSSQGPVWHLPADRTKHGEPLDIPLVPQVVGWLKELQGLAWKSEWVFPRRRRGGKDEVQHAAGNTLNAALQRADHGLEHFTVDDLRRTGRVQLAALGVRREVVEKCLGHMIRGFDGSLDRNDYFKERRQALEQWTQVLVRAVKGLGRGSL
jgi:integrase